MNQLKFLLTLISIIIGPNGFVYAYYGIYLGNTTVLYITTALPPVMLLCYCFYASIICKDINIFGPYLLVYLFALLADCILITNKYNFFIFGLFIYSLIYLYLIAISFRDINLDRLDVYRKVHFIFLAFQYFSISFAIILFLASYLDTTYLVLFIIHLIVINVALNITNLKSITNPRHHDYNAQATLLLAISDITLIINVFQFTDLLFLFYTVYLHWLGLLLFMYGIPHYSLD